MKRRSNSTKRIFSKRIRTTACVTALLILMAGLDLACTPVEEATHVIVLGVDGLSPAGIQRATTPHFNRLLAEGAFTFKARAVLGTSSSQNWASMIMGAGPEQHGVTSNGWERDNHSIAPTTTGAEDLFPTIFGVLRQQRPEAKIATFYDWGGFGRLFEKSVLDQDVDGDGPDETLRQAVAYITEQKPDFTFIHLDHVDHALHTEGHGSEEYYEAVEHTDVLLGELLDGLATAGLSERTILIVTADHGGVGTRHGGESMAELEIPWLIWGPGVAAGKQITDPVNTYDTAATVAYVLGLEQPYHWIARPVLSAFAARGDQVALPPPPPFVPLPRIHPEGGSVEASPVTLSVDAPGAEIRYTTDGSVPERASARYLEPFTLPGASMVRARAFTPDGGESGVSEATFLTAANGVRYSYHEGTWQQLPDFETVPSVREGQMTTFDLGAVPKRADYYAVRFEAYLEITEAGTYTFYVMVDDGANLYLDGEHLVDNDGPGGARERSGTAPLEPGRHHLIVDYFETYGDETLKVRYEGPGLEKQTIPARRLYLSDEE